MLVHFNAINEKWASYLANLLNWQLGMTLSEFLLRWMLSSRVGYIYGQLDVTTLDLPKALWSECLLRLAVSPNPAVITVVRLLQSLCKDITATRLTSAPLAVNSRPLFDVIKYIYGQNILDGETKDIEIVVTDSSLIDVVVDGWLHSSMRTLNKRGILMRSRIQYSHTMPQNYKLRALSDTILLVARSYLEQNGCIDYTGDSWYASIISECSQRRYEDLPVAEAVEELKFSLSLRLYPKLLGDRQFLDAIMSHIDSEVYSQGLDSTTCTRTEVDGYLRLLDVEWHDGAVPNLDIIVGKFIIGSNFRDASDADLFGRFWSFDELITNNYEIWKKQGSIQWLSCLVCAAIYGTLLAVNTYLITVLVGTGMISGYTVGDGSEVKVNLVLLIFNIIVSVLLLSTNLVGQLEPFVLVHGYRSTLWKLDKAITSCYENNSLLKYILPLFPLGCMILPKGVISAIVPGQASNRTRHGMEPSWVTFSINSTVVGMKREVGHVEVLKSSDPSLMDMLWCTRYLILNRNGNLNRLLVIGSQPLSNAERLKGILNQSDTQASEDQSLERQDKQDRRLLWSGPLLEGREREDLIGLNYRNDTIHDSIELFEQDMYQKQVL